MSSRNPFRTPVAAPHSTGASTTSTALPSYTSSAAPPPSSTGPPSYHSDDEDEFPEALPELTPRIPSGRPSQLGAQNTGSSFSPPSLPPRPSSSTPGPPLPSNRPQPDDVFPSADEIPESVPPPAYSVSPNVGVGERVVEQGPRRPFQRAPEPLMQLSTPPSQQQQQHSQPAQPQPPRFVAPAGPPPSGRPNSQLSDFAQDFYNSGGATTPPPAAQQPQQPRYAPPSAPPPPPRRPRAASTSGGAGSIAPPASDGRPTTTPTPGHPLLRNGKTLIYPENYLCQKCTFRTPCATYRSPTFCGPKSRKGQNTGYKNFDPSHPCRKCWDRFGKPYTSALASSPWGDQASGSASQSQRGRSFQRPLPAFKPPQAQAPRPPSLTMPGSYPNPVPSPTSRPMPVPMPYGGVPPPGAAVVMPGDPRIGGRLCWRCGGRGTTPFLIFDEMTCDTCGGIGRLVN